MTNFTDNSKHFTARPRLYRVWVPLHDDGKAPLISIWIDSTMTVFERQQRHEDTGPSILANSSIAEEVEDPMPYIDVAEQIFKRISLEQGATTIRWKIMSAPVAGAEDGLNPVLHDLYESQA